MYLFHVLSRKLREGKGDRLRNRKYGNLATEIQEGREEKKKKREENNLE